MDLQRGRLEMTDCWVNIMPRHTVHSAAPAPAGGDQRDLLRQDAARLLARSASRIPRLDKFMGAPPKQADCRPENRQQVSYDVAAGSADPVRELAAPRGRPESDRGERVSIIFNYNWV